MWANLKYRMGLCQPSSKFRKGEAGTDLQTSVAAEALKNVFSSGTTPSIRSFQSVAGSIETNNDQLPEHVVGELSKTPTVNFEIDAEKVAVDPAVEEKIQDAETQLDNPGDAVISRTLETPDVITEPIMMDSGVVENVISPGRYVKYDKSADYMDQVSSETNSAVGNNNIVEDVLSGQESSVPSDTRIETRQVADNQSSMVFTQDETKVVEETDFSNNKSRSGMPVKMDPMPHAEMRTSAGDDVNKPITNENIRIQASQDTKTSETVLQAFNEPSSQPETAVVAEAKSGKMQIQVELPMAPPLQSGVIQFHEDKSKSDVEIKPADFESPGGEAGGVDEKINTHTESINDVRPAGSSVAWSG